MLESIDREWKTGVFLGRQGFLDITDDGRLYKKELLRFAFVDLYSSSFPLCIFYRFACLH